MDRIEVVVEAVEWAHACEHMGTRRTAWNDLILI